MMTRSRAPFQLLLPLLFFGLGALAAGVAIRTAKLVAPQPETLLEAASMGQKEVIFRLVSEGEDPGLPIVLERPLRHWGRGDTTSALLVAIAWGDPEEVAYLARNTKRFAEQPNDLALCVAARYGDSNVARFLMRMNAPAVPENSCGKGARPEDIAAEYGFGGLSRELQQYRLESR